ncbi:uncharacterized protein LOC132042834 [Lycium ferocissimum]|uniref:uncharacterized protein LOC132042834 n=1 Tax=Lycium ferocissimum TaxID=112874 RepID=UPI0028169013|nr:uncharacterized protein LOC132042834 [Lycium ferocissimum]
MGPFEALYGRRYRSPIGWFDAFQVRLWGSDLLRESLDKVKVIQDKLLAAQSRQKEYADRKVRDFEFMVGEQDSILLDESLSYEEEPIAILDREVCKLRSKEIASVKVQWKSRTVEKATWETESDMRNKYTQLFTQSGPRTDIGILRRLGEKP